MLPPEKVRFVWGENTFLIITTGQWVMQKGVNGCFDGRKIRIMNKI
jgi:hypothetical protein